ncbi:MAG: peptidase S41, partial [Flavobacteriales bacterium]|nr:peptidase S41 [Flavobacteriales bacterium]
VHGELFSADSIRVDSSQVFRTRGGRIVYGGGGVMPDIFVPADTAEGSQFLTDLFFSGTLNQYAFDIADRDRGKLTRLSGPSEFKTRYPITDSMLEGLRAEARKQGIKERTGDLERSKHQIMTRLGAGVARNIWGDGGFYEVMLDTDSAFRRATSELMLGGGNVQK